MSRILDPTPTPRFLDAREPSTSWQWRRILAPVASLKLTVVLFSLSLVLVLCGTLAQVDASIEAVVEQYFRSMGILWIPLQLFAPRSIQVPGSFPFPGGWLIGAALLVNLLAAHAVRFQVSWRRSGILILHAGLMMLLVSELITGLFQVEAQMHLTEGTSANFVSVSNAVELALVDTSDPKHEDVVVIPHRLFEPGTRIEHRDLPVDVVINQYMTNSTRPEESKPGAANPATAGFGTQTVVSQLPEVAGTQQGVDVASAYVTFLKKGSDKPLGTYLTSMWFTAPQTLRVGKQTYQVSLRAKREYKPYTLHLIDFRHDLYEGTNKPKNFSSQVRLVNPELKEDREVKIWMNHPLRHAGETIYQSGFDPRDDKATILQVVRNPGWLLPYIACTLVALGMTVHFGQLLVRFQSRRMAGIAAKRREEVEI